MQEQQLLAGAVPSLQTWCPGPSNPMVLLHTEINGEVVRRETTSDPGNYMGIFDDLDKSLTGQGPNPVLPEDGLKTVKIIRSRFFEQRRTR